MTEKLSWRWTFWLMLILSSINTAFCIIFLQETYAPVLLARKAAALEKETGQRYRPAVYDPTSLPHRIYRAIQRPLRILFLQPIVFIMAVYMALIYGTLYLLFTTFPLVFQNNYGFSAGTTGLTYLGIGIGFLLAILFGIPQIDKQYRRLTAKNNGIPMPEFRMPVANVGAVCIPISLLWYGWSVQAHVYFLVPIIGISSFSISNYRNGPFWYWHDLHIQFDPKLLHRCIYKVRGLCDRSGVIVSIISWGCISVIWRCYVRCSRVWMGMYYSRRGRYFVDAYANVDNEVWKKNQGTISSKIRLVLPCGWY